MAEKFFGVEDIKVIGLTSTKNLIVSGVSTLGVTTLTNVTAQQLNVSGVSTLGVTTLTNVTAQQLNVSGVSTLGVTIISGIATIGIISGITTIGNVFIQPLDTGASVGEKEPGVSGVVTFYGDGSGLRNVVAIGTGIDIQNSGTTVGAASTINFGDNLTGNLDAGVYTVNVSGIKSSVIERSIFSSYSDYASHSETANYAYGIVGIGTTSYNEVGILTGSHAGDTNDLFGYSVATSADGKTIIVGAAQDETSGTDGYGVVYVFDRVGNTFNEVGILTGTHASDSTDYFSYSVDTSADGKTIVVGARNDEIPGSSNSSGVVYVFDRVGNTFNEVGILTGTYASDTNDYFGYSVATSADGKTIVVGARNDETSGTDGYGVVYVFDRVENDFNEVGILTGTYSTDGSDYFGNSVATSADGKTIIVGAYYDETPDNSTASGVVYVFDRVGNDFNQVGILTGSHANAAYDEFGYSVATSADGKTIVVGARNDEIPGSSNSSGVVYVFDREYSVGIGTTFNEVGILTGTYASGTSDYFGGSVATSADGKTIVVGAYADETPDNSSSSGVVYVFNRQGNNFNEVGILTGTYASDTSDYFGWSVATSADGKTIIVGAYNDEDPDNSGASGVVYVFDQDVDVNSLLSSTDGKNITIDSNLTVKGDIKGTADNADRSIFSSFADYASHSETSNGSYNLVGIGSTYSQVGILTGSGIAEDSLGLSVVTSSDGNTIVCAGNTTAVYVYDRVGTTFTEVGILTAQDNSAQKFGSDLACSADGNTIIVGADRLNLPGSPSDSGLVYVFDREGNNFNQVGILTGSHADDEDDYFGDSVACSADGNTIVVGAFSDEIPGSSNSSGVVYVFDREGTTFTQVGILTGSHANDGNEWFGFPVECSADGNIIVVGASRDKLPGSANDTGLVYVFDRVGTTTSFTQVGILTGSDTDDDDYFGWSVNTNVDGSTIIVGATKYSIPGSSDEIGSVYVFDREYSVGIGTTFTQVGILTGSHAADGDYFGSDLACSADGNIIVVTARTGHLPGSEDDSGIAYVFNRQGNNFNEVGILTGYYANDDNDYFGTDVACSADGKHIIVGAFNDELPGSGSGSGLVYVFDQDTKETPLIRVGVDNELFIDGNISIADTTSNAGGARYISTEAPSAGIGTEGDIWYDISSTGDSTGTNGNIPIGGIIMWYGSVANIPTSWRLCDGQSYSTAIGTIATPDLRGQFVVGAADDSVEGTFSNNVGVGSTGGSADAVIVEHEHTAGTLAGSFNMWPTADDDYFNSPRNVGGETSNTPGAISVTISGNTGSVGVGSTNANLPPYYALAYIMRIL